MRRHWSLSWSWFCWNVLADEEQHGKPKICHFDFLWSSLNSPTSKAFFEWRSLNIIRWSNEPSYIADKIIFPVGVTTFASICLPNSDLLDVDVRKKQYSTIVYYLDPSAELNAAKYCDGVENLFIIFLAEPIMPQTHQNCILVSQKQCLMS